MSTGRVEVAVIGGGIVGLAAAHELGIRRGRGVVLIEAEPEFASHQSGHNSGVLHSGLYYRPGSLKARLCTRGRERMATFCQERGLPYAPCGKLVVAVDEPERQRLHELRLRGEANGLRGLRLVSPEQMREREPHVGGIAGLLVPETGLVDFPAVARALADELRRAGHTLWTATTVAAAHHGPEGWTLETSRGALRAERLVACAGLQSDRVARASGLVPPARIVPFRGEYWVIDPARAELVRYLIYPVPDPRFPFLGVHLTRTLQGVVKVGPNAVPALARHGYTRGAFDRRDACELLLDPAVWRLGLKRLSVGVRELWRAWSRERFAREARRLLPALTSADLSPGPCGVRAQAVDRRGRLLDDFVFAAGPAALMVVNAPSPAATASLAIAERIADELLAAG